MTLVVWGKCSRSYQLRAFTTVVLCGQTTPRSIYDASESMRLLMNVLLSLDSSLRIFDGSAGFWLWVFRVSTRARCPFYRSASSTSPVVTCKYVHCACLLRSVCVVAWLCVLLPSGSPHRRPPLACALLYTRLILPTGLLRFEDLALAHVPRHLRALKPL